MSQAHPARRPAQVYCTRPQREKELGRAEAERRYPALALRGSPLTKALSPAPSRRTGGLVQTILREGKARLWFCFLGELLFSFFFLSFFWSFVCWRILCDLFHKKKKSYNWKVLLSGVVHFRGWVGSVSGCGCCRWPWGWGLPTAQGARCIRVAAGRRVALILS